MTSIIIPIYNTAMYIEKCIRSVLSQSREDWELILIDDGSTDESGKICDSYKELDNRIKVIHQQNAGQGRARNIGLDICIGEYITFLDSDDYWDDDFLEKLHALLSKYNADIAVAGYRCVDEDYQIIKSAKGVKKGLIKKYTGLEAAKTILYWKDFGVAPWAKIYKAHLWKNIRFKEDRIYEDLATTYLVYLKANLVVYDNFPRMTYYLRQNSDARSKFQERKMMTLTTATEILKYSQENKKELIKAAECRIVSTCFFLLFQIPNVSQYEYAKKQCILGIKFYRKKVLLDKKARKKTRAACLLSIFGFKITEIVYRVLKRFNQSF